MSAPCIESNNRLNSFLYGAKSVKESEVCLTLGVHFKVGLLGGHHARLLNARTLGRHLAGVTCSTLYAHLEGALGDLLVGKLDDHLPTNTGSSQTGQVSDQISLVLSSLTGQVSDQISLVWQASVWPNQSYVLSGMTGQVSDQIKVLSCLVWQGKCLTKSKSCLV